MKTFVPTALANQNRPWYLIDATNVVLGDLATKVADLLRGKNRADFTPHLDLGAYIVVINADKVKLSGKKMEDKIYYKHTGYIGHLKETKASTMLEKKPTKIIELAVKGMIPGNKLEKEWLRRLRVFAGAEHTYQAQKPELITIA